MARKLTQEGHEQRVKAITNVPSLRPVHRHFRLALHDQKRRARPRRNG